MYPVEVLEPLLFTKLPMCIDASVIVGRCPICSYIIREMRDEVNDYFVKEMSRDDIPVKWWAFSDSNRGHSVYETDALTN